MLPVSLSLNQKKVLIVGGGKVALRKAKQFLKQNALVYVLSKSVLDEFNDLPLTVIKQDYPYEELSSYFLVYAATHNHQINESILLKCHEKNILCGSATYSKQASFYSMGYEENDLGIVAVSMHQRLPYHKPLLSSLMNIFEEYRERLELLYRIRNYIVSHQLPKEDIFERLFEAPIDILKFLDQSIKEEKGYLFVYHHSDYKQKFAFQLSPSLYFDLKTYESTIPLFKHFKHIKIIPLILSEGKIYQRILDCKADLICCEPILSLLDLNKVFHLFHHHEEIVFTIHPREKQRIKDVYEDFTIYELDEGFKLEKDKNYGVVGLLMTKGQHYHDLIEKISKYTINGYSINFLGNLLENETIVRWIEDKVR